MLAGPEPRLLSPAVSPGALLAVVPDGFAAVGPAIDVEIGLAASGQAKVAAVDALASGADTDTVAALLGIAASEARELVDQLRELGVLCDAAPDPRPAGRSLAEAIRLATSGDGNGDGGGAQLIWTAEEALLVPPGVGRRIAMRALRSFVAGLRPDGRLLAYSLLAQRTGLVRGDVPDSERLASRLAEVKPDPGAITLIELADSGSVWTVAPDALDRIDGRRAHRLGPIQSCGEVTPVPLDGPAIHLCQAHWAVGNLRFPTPHRERLAQGTGSHEVAAESVARAEAIERYATSDLSFARLVPARRGDLRHAIARRELYAGNERQQPARSFDGPESGELTLWCAAVAGDGAQAWVPADAVYLTLPTPPGHPPVLPTSSGVAAHTDLREAAQRAFCELVERDAFMWTWVQRVSRERIAPETVPDDVARWVAGPSLEEWSVSWVNLSLETFPVILCAVHGQSGLVLGAACHESPVAALRRATVEAVTLALLFSPDPDELIDPRAVRTPRDHLLLHRDPDRRAEHAFLYSSDVEIPLSDVQQGSGRSLQERLTDMAVETLTVDLTSPQCAPYVVVRAMAPGLVPITFGWDSEPLGLPRLAQPRRTGDGRTVGIEVDLTRLGPILPHPFP